MFKLGCEVRCKGGAGCPSAGIEAFLVGPRGTPRAVMLDLGFGRFVYMGPFPLTFLRCDWMDGR